MSDLKETGKKGEQLAAAFLVSNGYEILHRNWRHRRAEIDIIASRSGVLHFIEVKTRTSLTFGYPEESVGYKKMKTLMAAGAAYQYKHQGWSIIQYDVLSIILTDTGPPQYLLLSDVDV